MGLGVAGDIITDILGKVPLNSPILFLGKTRDDITIRKVIKKNEKTKFVHSVITLKFPDEEIEKIIKNIEIPLYKLCKEAKKDPHIANRIADNRYRIESVIKTIKRMNSEYEESVNLLLTLKDIDKKIEDLSADVTSFRDYVRGRCYD